MMIIKFARLVIIPLLLLSLIVTVRLAMAAFSKEQLQLAKQLGWIMTPTLYNLCGGYYQELPIDYPKRALQSLSPFSANKASWSLSSGMLTLTGDVKVLQQNSKITANSATIRGDIKTNKIKWINVLGNVHFIAPGMLVIANKGYFDVWHHHMILSDVVYRIRPNAKRVATTNPKNGKLSYRIYQLSARGQAKQVKQTKPHRYEFEHASYTTCPPVSNVWNVKAVDMTLDYNRGWGVAHNVRLYIKGVPVFYFPYYSFPINRQRKTGLLAPIYGYSSNKGLDIGMPFYWNMAPNYDAIITPDIIARRGINLGVLFRYINKRSQWQLYGSVLMKDRRFAAMRRQALANYGNNPNFADRLRALARASDNRKAIFFQYHSQLNQHWQIDANYNYVSDDNYQQDLGSNHLGSSDNQLLQRLTINYASHRWHVAALLQRYQTLHPIDQSGIKNQYARLPQLEVTMNPIGLFDNIQATVAGDYTHFSIDKNPDSTIKFVQGDRITLTPSLSKVLSCAYGWLLPQFKLYVLSYWLNHPSRHSPSQLTRAIPVFDVHGKLLFDRDIVLFNRHIKQTLQPEIYYLFVPYINQQNLPLFDTTLGFLNYDAMFSDNRFVGGDRISDANQVTVGMTTSFIDDNSGAKKAAAGIAAIYYFHNRKVQACYGHHCGPLSQIDRQHVSPIAVKADYYFNTHVNLQAQLTWNAISKKIVTQSSNLQYQLDAHHVMNLGYYQVSDNAINGNLLPVASHYATNIQALKQAIFSFYWTVNQRWSLLGSLQHNWSEQLNENNGHLQSDAYNTYTYGVQYNSCCWALRMVGYHTFNGLNHGYHPQFDNGVYVQLVLKGLGSLGQSQIDHLLNERIAGYHDAFDKGVI